MLLSRGGQVFICARELLPSILLLRFGQLGSGGLLCYGAMQIRIGNTRIFVLEVLSLLIYSVIQCFMELCSQLIRQITTEHNNTGEQAGAELCQAKHSLS